MALKDATLNEKINFVLRLLAFIKSNKSENFKYGDLLQKLVILLLIDHLKKLFVL